jgi:hypothetical protein
MNNILQETQRPFGIGGNAAQYSRKHGGGPVACLFKNPLFCSSFFLCLPWFIRAEWFNFLYTNSALRFFRKSA